MISVLKTGPELEPVSVPDLRAHLKLGAQENAFLASLTTSARLLVEAQSGVRLLAQVWDVLFDHWPSGPVRLPHWPVIDIRTIKLLGGQTITVPPNIYSVDTTPRPALLFLNENQSWPKPRRDELGILIQLTAGYGTQASDVPEGLRLAVLMLAAHWYETDNWNGQSMAQIVPNQVSALIQPYRIARI